MGGISPISMVDILAYIQLFGTDDEEMFVSVISKADSVFLKSLIDKSETKSKPKATK